MLSAVYRVFYKELLISILGVLFAFLLLFYTKRHADNLFHI